MTTETPLTRTTPRGAELVGAALVGLAGTLLVAVLALVLTGGDARIPSTVGVMAGGSIALVFFLGGAFLVNAVATVQPQLTMMFALLTYTLEVVLLLVVFAALDRNQVFATQAEKGWVVAGLLVATMAWTVGHIRATTRLRIPAFEPVVGTREAGPETGVTREVGAR